MWSAGCVIAEMYNKKPFFPGKSSQDQLFRIASVLGKPTPQEIRAMNANYIGRLPDIEPIPMKKLLSFASPLGIDLLSKMLRYNPKDRI